jgi:hypothetical protein
MPNIDNVYHLCDYCEDDEADTRCAECGIYICPACHADLNDETYCPDCMSKIESNIPDGQRCPHDYPDERDE